MTHAATVHRATKRKGSTADGCTRCISAATSPCNRPRNIAESCRLPGSSAASSTAASNFSRSCGSVCSTCIAISSLPGTRSSCPPQASHVASSDGKYTQAESTQRWESVSNQYQSTSAATPRHNRNVLSPALSPRASNSNRRRRANCCRRRTTTGSRGMFIGLVLFRNLLPTDTAKLAARQKTAEESSSSRNFRAFQVCGEFHGDRRIHRSPVSSRCTRESPGTPVSIRPVDHRTVPVTSQSILSDFVQARLITLSPLDVAEAIPT